uniref:Sulfatase domain-containing protein n=1 Tax=Panagrellus redivivus TaxID=6233 RepID=A0A7E4W194_PANRE
MRFAVYVIIALTVVCLLVLFIDNATITPFVSDYTVTKDKEKTATKQEKKNDQPCLNVQKQQKSDYPKLFDPIKFATEAPPDYSKVIFDNCELPHLDPWDPSIVKFLKPNTKKKCDSKFDQLTKLENGLLTKSINASDTTCAYRCLHPVNDYKLNYGDWQNITDKVTPTCDVIETKCYKNDEPKEPFYEFMHAQVYRNETPKAEKKPNLPDVIIIIIDSVSHSSFVRTLPRTYYELMSNYEAIPFPHLNKIAINSRPNALAMFLGKSNRNIEKSPMSVGYTSDFKNSADCNKPLDDDQFVGNRFKEAGYTTMMNDDWALGPFNWPNCKGFVKQATHHMMKPYQLRYDSGTYKSKKILENIFKNVCRETYESLIDYLDDFVSAYPDKPKFTITWNIDIAHNDNNQLYRADNKFYNFFKENEAKLNESFVFIMGDHGMRFGGIRNTDIGETEDNNPLLLITLPYSLRQNGEVLTTVRQNSHQLITQYDLYATFVDIVRPKSENTTSNLLMHGSSLLRPLPQPRTCDRLRVPFEYCTCIRKKTKLPEDNDVGKVAALKMVEQMNEVIKTESSFKDICSPLALTPDAKTITVEQFKSEGTLNLFQVTFTVQPGGGKFWGYVGREGNSSDVTILSARFPRLDSYEKTASCAKGSAFTAYCYCKSLLKT